jgi:hypothetical protein
MCLYIFLYTYRCIHRYICIYIYIYEYRLNTFISIIVSSEPDSIQNDGLRERGQRAVPSSSSSSALLCYLQEKLDKITQGKSKSKITMICTWIVELMLHKIQSLEMFHNNNGFDNYLNRNNRVYEKKCGFEFTNDIDCRDSTASNDNDGEDSGIYVYIYRERQIYILTYLFTF